LGQLSGITAAEIKAPGVLNCSAALSSRCDNAPMMVSQIFLAVTVSSTLLLLTAFALIALR
jgi:hypothetical protein